MRRCKGCFSEHDESLSVCPFCGFTDKTEVDEAISLVPGVEIGGRYVIGRAVGHGGFGVTYIAWDKILETRVAVKEYLPGEFATRMPGVNTVTAYGGNKKEQFFDGLDKFVEEAKRLAKFQKEEGIVKVFDCIAENETAYIIMEYLEGETLKDFLDRQGTVPEDKTLEMLMPVMESLQNVHKAGILHRDIAPDNIFITKDGKVKLIDFGAARFATTSHSRSLTVIVKPGFSPEEQYRSRGDQGPHTDVYSLAALMYKMTTGITPPDALERRAKIEHDKKDPLKDPKKINKDVSITVQNAIMNALNVQIEDRTADIPSFISELTAEKPVKRRFGKIKKIDFYTIPLWVKIVVPTLVAIIVAFGALIATGVISFNSAYTTELVIPDGYVQVPYIEGLKTDEAIIKLEDSSLQYVITDSVVSPYLDADTILLQNPKTAQFVQRNSIVSVTISRGDGEILENIVPFVIGRSPDDFINDATIAGFDCNEDEIVLEYSDTVQADRITRVTLDDGTAVEYGQELTPGAHLIIYVSMGSEPFEMPDLYNLTLEEAQAVLDENGLICESVELSVNRNIPVGNVYEQSVAAGEEVQRGDGIIITVSANDADIEGLIEVPSVINLTESDAISQLQGAGLSCDSVIYEYSDSVPEGYVFRQIPNAGSRQPEGSRCTIYICTGVDEYEIPTLSSQEVPVVDNPVATDPVYTEPVVTETEPPTPTPIQYYEVNIDPPEIYSTGGDEIDDEEGKLLYVVEHNVLIADGYSSDMEYVEIHISPDEETMLLDYYAYSLPAGMELLSYSSTYLNVRIYRSAFGTPFYFDFVSNGSSWGYSYGGSGVTTVDPWG